MWYHSYRDTGLYSADYVQAAASTGGRRTPYNDAAYDELHAYAYEAQYSGRNLQSAASARLHDDRYAFALQAPPANTMYSTPYQATLPVAYPQAAHLGLDVAAAARYVT